MPRQKPYQQSPHHGICQDKNLTSSTPRSLHRGICQDKNLTSRARTTAFAKTKPLPQAPAQPSPRHLPRQKPYQQSPQYGICQDKNLTPSTRAASPPICQDKKPYQQSPPPRHLPRQNLTSSPRAAFTTAFVKTKTLPAEPAPRHLPRQKPTRSTRGASTGIVPRQRPYHQQISYFYSSGAGSTCDRLMTCDFNRNPALNLVMACVWLNFGGDFIIKLIQCSCIYTNECSQFTSKRPTIRN